MFLQRPRTLARIVLLTQLCCLHSYGMQPQPSSNNQTSKPTIDHRANMQRQAAQDVDKTGFVAPEQKRAIDYVKRIEGGVTDTNYTEILAGVNGLRLIDLMKIPQPDVVLRRLLKVYGQENMDTLHVGYKYQIARQAKRFTRAMFALNNRTDNPIVYDKELKETLLELMKPAISPVDEEARPSAGLRYELECARAGIGALSDGNSLWDDAKDEGLEVLVNVMKILAEGSVSVLMEDGRGVFDAGKDLLNELIFERVKKACTWATAKFRSNWYTQVLLVDYLGQCVLGDPEQALFCAAELKKTLEHHTPTANQQNSTAKSSKAANSKHRFKELRTKTKQQAKQLKTSAKNSTKKIKQKVLKSRYKWQVLYAALEAYARVALMSSNEEQQQKAFDILKQYASFKKFKWQNNWRVREKAAQGLILLTQHTDKDIATQASQVLAERRRKERNPRVLLLLMQPHYVTALEKAVAAAQTEQSSRYQEILQQHKDDMLQAIQQQLQNMHVQDSKGYEQDLQTLQTGMQQQQMLLETVHLALQSQSKDTMAKMLQSHKDELLLNLVQRLDELQQQAAQGNAAAAQQAGDLDAKLTRL
ncbi:MAG: hypothetical protein AAF310_06385, partial [Myxococcota bacterium]